MLINQTPYNKGDIVTFMLVTGQECIARFVDTKDDGYEVERPLSLMPSQQGMAMVPMGMTAQINTVVFKHQHIVFHGPTAQEAADGYIQGTSGIQIAKGDLNAANIQTK